MYNCRKGEATSTWMWRSRHLGFSFLILDWHRRYKSNFMGSSEHVQAMVLIFSRLSSLGIFPRLRMFSERNKCPLWALFAICYCLPGCFHLDPQNLGVRKGDAYLTRVTRLSQVGMCSSHRIPNYLAPQLPKAVPEPHKISLTCNGGAGGLLAKGLPCCSLSYRFCGTFGFAQLQL